MGKFLNSVLILSIFFLFHSCCSVKMSKYDKEYWDNEFNNENYFPYQVPVKASIITIPKIHGEIAVFPKEAVAGQLNIPLKDRFTPRLRDIENAEFLLKKSIKIDHTKNTDGIIYNRRQYFGFFLEGKKILWIKLFVIQNSCDKKSFNNYTFDKLFINESHPGNKVSFRQIILNDLIIE